MQIIKHPRIKVNKEILWKYHEAIQKEFNPFNEWYKLNGEIVEDLDRKRQEITDKYWQRKNDGTLRTDKNGKPVPIVGVDLKKWDAEMEALMTGEVEIEDNGAIKWPTTIPVPESMKVVK